LTFIGALSAFDVIYATTRGGPGRATEIYNMVVLRHFGSGLFGFSTAMSVVLVASIMITAVPLITYLRRREVEL
ncbi:MAG: sugar ABC transporter permease, partial [Acidimicrobiia bacterium]